MSNRILSVVHGPEPETLIVTVSGTLVEIGDLGESFEVVVEEEVIFPDDADLQELPAVTLSFGRDVSSATTWRVPDAGAWVFEGGAPLSPPLSGDIL